MTESEYNVEGELKQAVIVVTENDELYILERELLEMKELMVDMYKLTNNQAPDLKIVENNTEQVINHLKKSVQDLKDAKKIQDRIYKILGGAIIGAILGGTGLFLGPIPGLITLGLGTGVGGSLTAFFTRS